MPSLDRPPLSADMILGAVKRHGLTLERSVFKHKERACAVAAYAIACDPELAQKEVFNMTVDAIRMATGLNETDFNALVWGFDGVAQDRFFWLPYRRAYHVGREVWARRAEVEVKVETVKPVEPASVESAPASPPLSLGRPIDDDREPALAAVGAEDLEPADHWRSSLGG